MTAIAPDWRDYAVCRTEKASPDVFVPPLIEGEDADGEATRLHHEIAKAYCRRCPVTDECLEWALQNFERVGVWGNTTPRERRIIWRERRLECLGLI